ncbi:L-histidine N(alpha)-methyltransferase [Mucilaginibacter hurinus]|uniref:L-histidine N(Alpha)-methyltransferase n=1 Tax=Mucilaginibacter hurinus TaxID=2201324 RepID=A0A367GPX8_9SPHI|nr:L-histidine N(alpha)-methyltransferase [Mucilaginibacter hurinus]RCH54753.1 L-histidine N(alpha)-methyltransferase [Mucilaginibacter hurinus]
MLTQRCGCNFTDIEHKHFYNDVIKGLRASPKRLHSKYFYDERGDELFQQIMNSPEYYPTDCEMEIFTRQTHELAKIAQQDGSPFDLIELGAGDATKSFHLLKYLVNQETDFTYLPIDISSHVITYLEETLPLSIPGLNLNGLNGEYFEMLKKASALSNRRKVILLLGGNIGNMPVADAQDFCIEMRRHLSPGDIVVMGVDLKKNPKVIRAAYEDAGGVTKQFNLNLLLRINRELNADFNVDQFDHYCNYEPETGACKSYLISLINQQVCINGETFIFKRDDYIWMEISQKYTVDEINQIAIRAGYRPMQHLTDSKQWFIDGVFMAE